MTCNQSLVLENITEVLENITGEHPLVGWVRKGDDILQNLCEDYLVNHYEDPYEPTSIISNGK